MARYEKHAWIWLAAALVPLAVRLLWTAAVRSPAPTLADCTNLFSPTAVARVVEAVVVIGTLAVLGIAIGADRRSLALRWPSARIAALSIAAPIVIAPAALIVGPLLTGPFFGTVRIQTADLAAVAPALVLAISNATMEELVFRGAILGWGARAIGPRNALILQAVLFGLAHAGSDFVNPLAQLPVIAAVAVGGVIAGLIVRRTGSLLLPIAVHAAFDIPLYYAFACRLPG